MTMDLSKCPRCGGVLLAFSPSGKGVAACDACCVYWEDLQDLRADLRAAHRRVEVERDTRSEGQP